MNEQHNASYDQNQIPEDERHVRVLSPGMLVFRRFVRNRLAIAGLIILVFMFSFSFLGGLFSPYTQAQVFHRDEMIMKEYASCMVNTDLRYTLCSGAAFPQAAYAQAALAVAGDDVRDERVLDHLGADLAGERAVGLHPAVLRGNGVRRLDVGAHPVDVDERRRDDDVDVARDV